MNKKIDYGAKSKKIVVAIGIIFVAIRSVLSGYCSEELSRHSSASGAVWRNRIFLRYSYGSKRYH